MTTFPRKLHGQVPVYIAKRVTYSDTGIDTGVLEMPASLPANAFILRTTIDVETAFAATTTNVLTVGTVSGTANDIVTAGDLNETTAVPQQIVGPGMLSATAEKKIYIKFTGAGAANTAGAAVIVVEFIDLDKP